MSVALSIAFTGLCALIGNGDGKPGEILLVDAKGIGDVGGATLPAHAPTLVVNLRDLANPETSGPTRIIASAPNRTSRVDQLGVWDLTGSEIWIRPQGEVGTGVQLFLPSRDNTSWPEAPSDVHDPAAWRDLRFVPNMKSLVGDGRIDPALVGNRDGLPRSVAARVHLDGGLLEGAIPSQEEYRNQIFEFSSRSTDRTVRQAMTDTVQWTLQTDAGAVVIDIVPTAGGPAKRLLLAPSATPHRLFVSNLPAENPSHAGDHHAMNDEEVAALHFGAYYKLLMHEPADKPLPRLSHSQIDRKGAGFAGTAYCPPAMFPNQ